MKLYGYLRRSQDDGAGVSLEIQTTKIDQWAALYGHDVTMLPPDLDESSQTLDRPSMSRALAALEAREVEGIVVAFQDRLTRRSRDFHVLLERAHDCGGHLFAVDTGLDTTKDTTMHAVFAVFAEREYKTKLQSMNDSRRNAVETHGVHGGSVAPLGYDWTTRGETKTGKVLRGPLEPTDAAPRVLAGFEAFDGGASWREVIGIFGVKSAGNARSILENRVYLGEARSGDFVKANAHPAIVGDALFARVGRKLRDRAPSVRKSAKDSSVLAGVLRCSACGLVLRFDGGSRSYRCKNLTCKSRASVNAEAVEAYVLEAARDWHTISHADVALATAVDEAVLPALEAAVLEAQAEVLAVEAAEGLSPLRKAEAATAADAALEAARRALDNAEASSGWHGLTPERVADKLQDADAPTLNAFVREMIAATVAPTGRAKRVPVAERLALTTLIAGKTASQRDANAALRDRTFSLRVGDEASLEAYRA